MQAGHLRSLARRVARDDLKREIGKMRHMAEVNALPCVSDLAYGLEHLLAHGWSRTMARHYFDAMDEAIASDCGDGDMRAAMLDDISHLPFAPRLVTLFHVLEHLEEPGRALAQIAKFIDPEGWLVIEVPDILAEWRGLLAV